MPPATEPTIAALAPGDRLAGTFACVRKDRASGRSGPYLALDLRDRTGTMPARIFRDVDRWEQAFDRGDVVVVAGSVDRYRDGLVAELSAIRRADPGTVDPARFLPAALRDLDELDGFLEGLAAEVGDDGFGGLLRELLGDERLRAQWRRAPCSIAGHHAYLGGLLEHTVAVAALANEACVHHPGLNRDLLLTACLVHDVGKTREYTYGAEFGRTSAGELLGHVELGLRVLSEPARRAGLDEDRWAHLAHCVLTHHGADRVGGRFRSAEAAALHRLNAVDVAVKDALVHGLGHG
ncbi:MAG: HD domain-containing protein [Solirubrobacteraceae bacterium]|nr:HD domain-containing protein [Solirubrobacteraceae bacterium]